MYRIAKLPNAERRILFRNTAQKIGLNEVIVEKDFWVCLTLDYLFHDCEWKEAFTFKGGTSLSKCYGLIKRFSEDIDLILDWRVLGYYSNEPWEKRSKAKQDQFNKEANAGAEVFLKEKLSRGLCSNFLPVFEGEADDVGAVDDGEVHHAVPAFEAEFRQRIGHLFKGTQEGSYVGAGGRDPKEFCVK